MRDLAPGRAAAVLRPGTVEEAAEIVRRCAEARVGVIPHAGGTGLVGGQLKPEGVEGVVVSIERLNRVREVNPDDDVMIVEAGVILADAQAAAEAAGRLFPLSIASEGSARIGGVLGTNAGGLNVLRYGMARDLCLGVEAVLPDGSVLRSLKRLRKDNTGYDLRGLLIGSEGTLGLVTAACLRLFPRPAEATAAFVSVPSPDAALALLHHVRAAVGEQLALDGALSQSDQQRADFWRLRESIPEGNRKVGSVASHDISLPLSRVARFVEEAAPKLREIAPDLRINPFGHLGDGNLHYNLFPAAGRRREDYAQVKGALTRVVHDLVDAHGGSISAEHGIGRVKTADLVRYGDPAKLAAMRAIKAALDPHGIMNPGAVLA